MAPKRKVNKITAKSANNARSAKVSFNLKDDEEIVSSDDEEIDSDIPSDTASSEDEQETAEEKRKRLAKEYLQSMKDEIESDDNNSGDDNAEDPISLKLRKGRLESQGKYFRTCAESAALIDINELPSRYLSGHDVSTNFCVKCVAHHYYV